MRFDGARRFDAARDDAKRAGAHPAVFSGLAAGLNLDRLGVGIPRSFRRSALLTARAQSLRADHAEQILAQAALEIGFACKLVGSCGLLRSARLGSLDGSLHFDAAAFERP